MEEKMTFEIVATNDRASLPHVVQLQDLVNTIASDIQFGIYKKDCDECDGEACGSCLMSAFDWIEEEALDIEWILHNDRSFKSARVLVAFGGPNIWVDFKRGEVQGFWASDSVVADFHRDAMYIEDALEELFSC